MKLKELKMAEEIYVLNKDMLIIKFPKKSATLFRMIMLAVVMICTLYMCSVCMKQITIYTETNLSRVRLIEQPCQNLKNSESDIHYVHYPEPATYSRKECACTPVRFFAIVSMQRSGSGWFETLLNSHINVSSNGEVFNVRERRRNISAIIGTFDKIYNLDWYSSASKNECTAAVGFKWMLNQGLMDNYEEILDYFSKRAVSVIFLFRRNRLRQWVSLLSNSHDQHAKQLNGTHKAHVHSQHEADILARYKPTVDVNTLVPKLKQLSDWATDAIERLKSTRHIVLYYEDLVQNHTKLLDVMEFLQMPKRALFSRHVKIHTKPLSFIIENYKDVHGALVGTEYESYLTQDYQM